MSKRGISELISTVLIILITISAASLIYSFVSPLIRDAMAESKLCSNAGLEIVLEDSCYDAISKEAIIGISAGSNSDISGISVVLAGVGTVSVRLLNGTVSGVRESGEIAGTLIDLPLPDEGRTYIIKTENIPSSVTIYPIVKIGANEKVCKNYAQSGLREC
jgi:flagellin-like protein